MLKIAISAKTTHELHEQIKDLYEVTFAVVRPQKTPQPEAMPVTGYSPVTTDSLSKTTKPDETPKAAESKDLIQEEFKDLLATKEETVAALARIVEKYGAEGMAKALKVLKSFGGDKLSEIPVHKYSEVVLKCQEVLAN